MKGLPECITQNKKHFLLSNQYNMVRTEELLEEFQEHGWMPVKITQVKSCVDEGFQRHMVRLREEGVKPLTLDDPIFPEIVITNSHNGTSKLTIDAGLFRLVCANGMVVSNGSLFDFHSTHLNKNIKRDILVAIGNMFDKLPYLLYNINNWKELILTPEQQITFAEKAIEMKKVADKGNICWQSLLLPKRLDDRTPSLWNTFSIIQEKFTQGGSYTTVTHGRKQRHRLIRSKGVKSVSQNVSLNKNLWEITEKYAQEITSN